MAKESIAKAYVQILPTTENLKVNLNKDLEPQLEAVGASGGKLLGGALVKALGALGIGKAIKESLDLGGALEQSIGGVETLFKGSAERVKAYANEAYATAGVSANRYMEIVTGFSASLLQGLGGDTEKAANIADIAMRDMSDNVNKFGNQMDTVQAAYSGFARQTYTMLDSLKLGYGGSASEMARLVNESGILGDAIEVTAETVKEVPFDQIILAINKVQQKLGVTGATAEEAATTLQGSFAAVKASLENTIANIALGENVKPAFEALISTSKTYLFDNLLPMVGNIAKSIPTVVTSAVKEGLPALLDAGKSLVTELKTGFVANLPQLIKQGLPMLKEFTGEIRKNAGELVDMGIDMIVSLVDGLIEGLPDLIAFVPLIISDIAGIINDNMPKILKAGIEIILALIKGLIQSIPDLIANMGNIIQAIADVITAVNWIDFGVKILEAIGKGLLSMGSSLANLMSQSFSGALQWLKNLPSQALQWGADMIAGFARGITSSIGGLLKPIKNAAAAVKSYLHFSRPDVGPLRDYETWMPDFMAGLANGIRRNEYRVRNAVDDVTAEMMRGFEPVTVTGSLESYGGQGGIERLVGLVESLSDKMDRMRVVLDSGKLVGGIKTDMNKALGDESDLEARGVA